MIYKCENYMIENSIAASKKKSLIKQLKEDLIANEYSGKIKSWFALFMCPAFLAIFLYRLSHYSRLKWGKLGKLISLILWRLNILMTGCHISPLATIGYGLKLPHPIGIVIGEGVKIGNYVTIYQSVTLGRADTRYSDYPIICDYAMLSSGSVIVGKILVGENALIGANSFVNKNIPEHSVAVGSPAKIIQSEKK